MAAPATQAIGTKYGVKGNMWAAGHHTGVDYLCPTGTSLKAPDDGKILHAGANSSTGWGAAYGIHVIGESVIGGKTYRWMTAHMSSVSVRAGQTVKLGATLGKSGATGNVTGPHCHFEVRIANFAYGHDVNPTVATNVKASSSSAKPPIAVWGKPETFVLGATGADVTRLGERLVVWAKAFNLSAPYKTGPGSPFSTTDVAAVKAFQEAQGWSGADADGYPGVETFKRLAADPKPTTDPEPPVKPTDTLTILTNNLWGYGKAESSSTQTVRLPRFVALVKKHMPDHVCVQELSNQTADKKVQRGDTEAKTPFDYVMDNLHDLGYAYDSIGSDGRYIFRLKSEVQFIKGKTILMTPEYEGDDKQAALGVYKKGARTYSLDSAHTENEGVDDKYRVGQTKSLLKQVFDFVKPLGVDTRWQFHAGDFNDHDAVLAAFKERGFVDAFTRAPLAHRIKAAVQSFGTYLKILTGKRIDLVTVYKDITVLRAEQITDPDYDDSDHKAQLVEIQL